MPPLHDAQTGDSASARVHAFAESADRKADDADRAAGARDRLAEARNSRARKIEKSHGGLDRASERARLHATRDRTVAAADRSRAADDRARAADDRARARTERSAYVELRAWSTVDSTTGLLRREAGIPALQHLHHSSRPPGQIVVAFVDVDGLKLINDLRGHRAGDAVLRALALLLTAALDQQDVAMRYGGDEFLVGASGITIADLSSRLTHAALDLWRENAAGMSFGVANAHEHDTLDDAIEHADRALYATRRRLRPA